MGAVLTFPFDRSREGVNPPRQTGAVAGDVARDSLQFLNHSHPVGIADLFKPAADLFVLGLAVGAASALFLGNYLHSMAVGLHASNLCVRQRHGDREGASENDR